MSDQIPEKEALRREMRARRAALRADWIRPAGARVQAHLLGHRRWAEAKTVALYWPLPGEVPVDALFRAAGSRTLLLPRCEGRKLVFHRWRPGDTLVPGPFRIAEPPPSAPVVDVAEVDLFVVPGLAFDRSGGRLGQGMAYYDRALGRRRGLAVGYAWAMQVVDRVPLEPHDVPLDGLVTEEGWVYGG